MKLSRVAGREGFETFSGLRRSMHEDGDAINRICKNRVSGKYGICTQLTCVALWVGSDGGWDEVGAMTRIAAPKPFVYFRVATAAGLSILSRVGH